MKSIITMQRLLKNNYSKVNSDLDVGIILTNLSDLDFGKLIFVN